MKFDFQVLGLFADCRTLCTHMHTILLLLSTGSFFNMLQTSHSTCLVVCYYVMLCVSGLQLVVLQKEGCQRIYIYICVCIVVCVYLLGAHDTSYDIC